MSFWKKLFWSTLLSFETFAQRGYFESILVVVGISLGTREYKAK